MMTLGTPLMWALCASFVTAALIVDVFAMAKRGAHRVSIEEAALWSLVWMVLSFVFVGWQWWHRGWPQRQCTGGHEGARVRHGPRGRQGTGRRQHLRIPAGLHRLCGAGCVPEAGADHRHPGRAGPACGDDPDRCLPDRAVALDPGPVRCVPRLHRYPEVVGRRSGTRPRGECVARLDAQAHEDRPGRRRRAVLHGRRRREDAARRRLRDRGRAVACVHGPGPGGDDGAVAARSCEGQAGRRVSVPRRACGRGASRSTA